ncbi:MAG: prepilin-type N-terminal cleavage/methylation domain-containing protein [Dehalococcoidales bacterium]|nr:prepilin-type N-terminal cleavage/methylation domain-containing protein [Dehalococcoidales bacterium]
MRNRQEGFTLLEMIISVGIAGLVIVAAGMTLTTIYLNSQQPTDQHSLLQQLQNAGYQMPRDIQMSNEVLLGDDNGFPITINIPVDQNTDNDYRVIYLIDGNELKRQQFDSSDNLIIENVLAQYLDIDDTTFESFEETLDGWYRFTVTLAKNDEMVSASYEARRRLTAQ